MHREGYVVRRIDIRIASGLATELRLMGLLLVAAFMIDPQAAYATRVLADGSYSFPLPDAAANNGGYFEYTWTADTAGAVTISVSPFLNCSGGGSEVEGATGYYVGTQPYSQAVSVGAPEGTASGSFTPTIGTTYTFIVDPNGWEGEECYDPLGGVLPNPSGTVSINIPVNVKRVSIGGSGTETLSGETTISLIIASATTAPTSGLVVTAAVPAQTVFVANQSSSQCSAAGGTITCTIGSLINSSANVTVTLSSNPAQLFSITFTAANSSNAATAYATISVPYPPTPQPTSVPTLPAWSALLLAILLVGISLARGKMNGLS